MSNKKQTMKWKKAGYPYEFPKCQCLIKTSTGAYYVAIRKENMGEEWWVDPNTGSFINYDCNFTITHYMEIVEPCE